MIEGAAREELEEAAGDAVRFEEPEGCAINQLGVSPVATHFIALCQ